MALSAFPAAFGTLLHVWVPDERSLYELPVIGWLNVSGRVCVPLTLYEHRGVTARAISFPDGGIFDLDSGGQYATLEEWERIVIPLAVGRAADELVEAQARAARLAAAPAPVTRPPIPETDGTGPELPGAHETLPGEPEHVRTPPIPAEAEEIDVSGQINEVAGASLAEQVGMLDMAEINRRAAPPAIPMKIKRSADELARGLTVEQAKAERVAKAAGIMTALDQDAEDLI